jgi:hypothetical protein
MSFSRSIVPNDYAHDASLIMRIFISNLQEFRICSARFY